MPDFPVAVVDTKSIGIAAGLTVMAAVRMVEEGDVVMAELTGTATRNSGEEMRMSMAEVFVMRDGKIIEQGTHDELLAKGGFYTTLYNSQFQAV